MCGNMKHINMYYSSLFHVYTLLHIHVYKNTCKIYNQIYNRIYFKNVFTRLNIYVY